MVSPRSSPLGMVRAEELNVLSGEERGETDVFAVRRLPTQSRSRHFGGVSEKKNSLGPRERKRISRAEY